MAASLESGVDDPQCEFDLKKALVLGGCAFEAYNVPSKANYADTFDFRQQWSNGTAVTYTDRAIVRDLIKGWLLITVHRASNLPKADFLTRSSDPYVTVQIPGNYARTPTIPTNLNPEWNTTMCLFVRDPASTTVTVECYDEDKGHKMKADDLLGTATFTVQDILDKGGDGSNDVSLDLALKDGLVKKGSEATVSLTARFDIAAQATAIKTSDNTDAILADVGLQTNGDMFKQVLHAAGIAAEREMEPVLYFDNQGSHTQAWLFWNTTNRVMCLAFRGTEQDAMNDFFTDANLVPWSYELMANDDGSVSRKQVSPMATMFGTWVHSGFLAGYDSISDTIAFHVQELLKYAATQESGGSGTQESGGGGTTTSTSAKPWQLWITGHSLGGALATLAASELSIRRWVTCPKPVFTMYNFGSPRVGNAKFVDQYNALVPNSWRIVNKNDVVTNVPQMVIGYRHVGHKVKLDTGGQVTFKLVSEYSKEGGHDNEEDEEVDEVVKQLEDSVVIDDGKEDGAGAQGVIGKATAKMSTLWSGSAIADHMEDRYLANLKDVYEKVFGVSLKGGEPTGGESGGEQTGEKA